MNKFCSNCGAELHENADFCVKCGVAVSKFNNAPKPEGRGCGIASLVLGISSLIQGMFSLFIFMCLVLDGEFFYFEEKIIFGFFFLFTPTVLSIIVRIGKNPDQGRLKCSQFSQLYQYFF